MDALPCTIDDFITLRNEKPEFTINNKIDRTKFFALWHLYNELKTNRLWRHEAGRGGAAEHYDAEMLTLLVEHLNPAAHGDSDDSDDSDDSGDTEAARPLGLPAARLAEVRARVQRGIVMMNWRTYSVSIEDKIYQMNNVVSTMTVDQQIAYFQLDRTKGKSGFFYAIGEIYSNMTDTHDAGASPETDEETIRTATKIFEDILKENIPYRDQQLNAIIERCSDIYKDANHATGGAAAEPVSPTTASWANAFASIVNGILTRNFASIVGGLALYFRLGATEEGKTSLNSFNKLLRSVREPMLGPNEEPLLNKIIQLIESQFKIMAATAGHTSAAVGEAALRETTVSRETLGHITHLALSASKAAAVNAGRVTVRCAIFPMIHLVMSVGLLFANTDEGADNGGVADAMNQSIASHHTPTSPKIVRLLRNIITLMSERHLTMTDLNIANFVREVLSQLHYESVTAIDKLHEIGVLDPNAVVRRPEQPVPELPDIPTRLPDIPTRVSCYLMMVLGRDPNLITFSTFCDDAGRAAGGGGGGGGGGRHSSSSSSSSADDDATAAGLVRGAPTRRISNGGRKRRRTKHKKKKRVTRKKHKRRGKKTRHHKKRRGKKTRKSN
jgi:hypothetical protein